MNSAAPRSGGLFEGLYRVIMRRNSVYVTFIIAGAFVGERAVDYGVHKLWEYNNVGLQIIYQFQLLFVVIVLKIMALQNLCIFMISSISSSGLK
ncbi:hypothetical protein SDJN02_09287, partial [Cucurbita argyrosperma subsp. argyrosperma]